MFKSYFTHLFLSQLHMGNSLTVYEHGFGYERVFPLEQQ